MFAVIFRAEVREFDEEYFSTAAKLRDLAMSDYGCKEFCSYTEANNEVAISYWDTESQITEWKQNIVHAAAQGKGKSRWYKNYTVQVVKVVREYSSG